MKRIAVIFLSVYYLLGSVGVAVNLHYCGNELSAVAVASEKAKCCCNGSESMDDCCDDEQVFFQIDDDQKVVQNFRVSFDESTKLTATSDLTYHNNYSDEDQRVYAYSDLPPPFKQPIYLLDCSLVYYG